MQKYLTFVPICGILYAYQFLRGVFMNRLEQARNIINICDENIAKLFEDRMHAVENVIAYKKENGLPVLDAAREKEVIERNLAKIQDEKLKPYYEDLLVQLMRISREYQKDILEKDI